MAARRPTRLLAAALVALMLASAVAPGFAGAAESDSLQVTRTGETVHVGLDASAVNGTPDSVDVTVNGEAAGTVNGSEDSSGTLWYNTSIETLALPRGDLSDATVAVTVDGKSFNDTANLQYLTFGSAEHATFESGDLLLPVNSERTYGFAVEADVNLQANDSSSTVTATLTAGSQRQWLRIEGSVLSTIDPLRTITFDVTDRGGLSRSDRPTTVDPRVAAETNVTPTDAGLDVSNPLLLDGEEYGVEVRDGDGAVYPTSATATGSSLTVEHSRLAWADSVTVRVERDGTLVNETEQSLAEKRTPPAKANVTTTEPATFAVGENVSGEETLWVAVGRDDPTRVLSFEPGEYNASNGTVTMPDHRVAQKGSYRLTFVGDEVVRAEVTGNGESSLVAVDGGDESGTQSVVERMKDLSLLWKIVGAFGLLGLFVFVGIVLVGTLRTGGAPSGSSGGTSSHEVPAAAQQAHTTPTHEVTVEVVDAVTGDRLNASGSVSAVKRTRAGSGSSRRAKQARTGGRSHGGAGSRDGSVGEGAGLGEGRESETLANGRATFELKGGTWTFTADVPGVDASKRREVRGDTTIRLEADPGDASVRVGDAAEGHPVAGASVTFEPDAGDRANDITGDTGRASFDDVPASASSVTVSASHDRYADASTTMNVEDGGGAARVDLEPLTGAVEVEVTVDGTPVGGVPVVVSAEDEFVAANRQSAYRATAGDDGVARFDGLMVGEYAAYAEFESDDLYSGRPERVRVEDGGVERVTYDASFTYRLSDAQTQRVADLLAEARALGESSGSDAVVPRYYGTVVESLLDAVERLPDHGHRFAAAGVADPDAVVDALLDAAEAVLDCVSRAMGAQRNTDLFAACSDLPDRQVAWGGRFDVDDLFDLLAGGRVEGRQRLAERLESVDGRISDAQGELATLSPVREPWEELRELVREERGGDQVRAAAMLFAADGMLAAVADALDEPELRKRLQRTVF